MPPDSEDHVIKNTPDSMILKFEILPKTFEILERMKSRTGFFGVADPLSEAKPVRTRCLPRTTGTCVYSKW